jgi:hypothetical protein
LPPGFKSVSSCDVEIHQTRQNKSVKNVTGKDTLGLEYKAVKNTAVIPKKVMADPMDMTTGSDILFEGI